MKFIKLDIIDSTNNYAKNLLEDNLVEDTVVFTYSQSKGRGLGINTWHSDDNKNLLFSLIIFPNIEIERNFLISMLISLGICDYMENKGINTEIKWPNDIFYDKKKLCGILIENSIYGDLIKNSVIGIGVNLNQSDFPYFLNNVISISNITGEEYNIEDEIRLISGNLLKRLSQIKDISFSNVKHEYLKKLFMFNVFNNYKVDEEIISFKIVDIETDGHLIVENKFKEVYKYYFKEIEFII